MATAGAMRWLVALAVGFVLLSAAGCVGSGRDSGAPAAAASSEGQAGDSARRQVGARVGNLAPEFALRGLDGETVRLSDLRGKAVMVNFWATWCPPCKQEMPDIEKAYQKYRDQGVVFLGIDMKEDADTVGQFVRQNGFHWTFLLDTDGQVATDFRVSAIPTSYFIDREGVIRDLQFGAMGGSLLEAKLSKIR